jgi:hypothetical protein
MDTVKPAMTTNGLPSVADVLHDAATWVRDNGYDAACVVRDNFFFWARGFDFPLATPAEGAIAVVIYGDHALLRRSRCGVVHVRMPVPNRSAKFRLFREAIDVCCDLLDIRENENPWSFHESTTAEDVSTDLEEAAALWGSTQLTNWREL